MICVLGIIFLPNHVLYFFASCSFTYSRFWKPAAPTTYEAVVPATVSPRRCVPDCVPRPDYADSGKPPEPRADIDIKDKVTIEAMRCAGQLARVVLEHGQTLCKVRTW